MNIEGIFMQKQEFAVTLQLSQPQRAHRIQLVAIDLTTTSLGGLL